MNFVVLSLVLICAAGSAFGYAGGSHFILLYVSPLLSVIAIMTAAMLVRLNRGVPSVDWKSVDTDSLTHLLDGIERITKEYIVTFAVALICIVTIIVIALIDAANFQYKQTSGEVASYLCGGIIGLLLSRMSYIIWLDLDIVRLQRAVIVSAAETNESIEQRRLAVEKLANMKRVSVTQL